MNRPARLARPTGPIVRTLSRPAVHGFVAGLALCLTALPAGAQQQPTQPVQQAPAVADPPPPGPGEETQYIDTSSLEGSRRSSFLSTVVAAMKQASGVRVSSVTGTNKLVVTGTPEKIAVAKSTYAALAEEFQARAREEVEGNQAVADSPTPTGVTLDFPGGTVLSFLEQLGNAVQFEGFVVRDEELLREMQLPPIRLRGTDLSTAVQALVGDNDNSVTYNLPDGRTARVQIRWLLPAWIAYTTGGRPRTAEGETLENLRRSICLISVVATSPKKQPPIRTVFDLSRPQTVGKAQVQSILDAISLAVELDGESPSFRAKYHEPSGILIVRGTDAEIALVREIVQLRVPGAKSHATEGANAEAVAAPSAPAATPSQPATPKSR